MSAIDRMLDEARRLLPRRPTAYELPALRARGALIVDIRPFGLRDRDGPIAGAVVVDRNQLEWRLDPTSEHRLPEAADPDREIVLVCDEGYASSLAALTLQQLGLRNATDLDGGYQAVRIAGTARDRRMAIMSDAENDERQDWNSKVIAEFRENGGKVGGMFENMPMVLLHTTGARSGAERVNPLAYRREGDAYVVFGSKAGAPTAPDWFHNLKANPKASIEVGAETKHVVARIAEGDERDRIWEDQKKQMPGFAEYEAATSRVIPVIILEPAG